MKTLKKAFVFSLKMFWIFVGVLLIIGIAGAIINPRGNDNSVSNQSPGETTLETPSTAPDEKTSKSDASPGTPTPKYTVVETKMLNDARIIGVTTDQLDRAEDIAADVVDQNKSYYMVRVFFYSAGQTPGKDMPSIRYEWTETEGLIKSYDTIIPQQPDKPDPALPKYEVIFKVKQLHNDRIYGDVLMASITRATSAKRREQIARAVCDHEGLDDISLFRTREAQKANDSASYAKDHPNALREGFLGSLTDGTFLAGETMYP